MGPSLTRSRLIRVRQRYNQRFARFTLGSCQYPAGFLDEPVAYRSYGEIVERLDREYPSYLEY